MVKLCIQIFGCIILTIICGKELLLLIRATEIKASITIALVVQSASIVNQTNQRVQKCCLKSIAQPAHHVWQPTLKLKSNQNICNWIEILLRVVLAHHALASAGKNSKLKKKRILIGNCLSFKTVINVNNAKSVEMGLGWRTLQASEDTLWFKDYLDSLSMAEQHGQWLTSHYKIGIIWYCRFTPIDAKE